MTELAHFDIHEINEYVSNLAETIPAASPEIGVFERLYYLRSNEKIVKEKSWKQNLIKTAHIACVMGCLLYTSPSPRDYAASRMPSSA